MNRNAMTGVSWKKRAYVILLLREITDKWCPIVEDEQLYMRKTIDPASPKNVTHIHFTMRNESPVISRSSCMT